MKAYRILGCALLLLCLAQGVALGSPPHGGDMRQVEQTARQMAYLKLLLGQLRQAAASIKDIDALVAVGMPREEVADMRKAMELKIRDMQKEAVLTIHSL